MKKSVRKEIEEVSEANETESNPKDNLFKNIFDFTTAGDWDCVASVERIPALYYSVVFFSCFLESWVSFENLYTLISVLWCMLCFQRTFLITYLTSLQLVIGTVWRR